MSKLSTAVFGVLRNNINSLIIPFFHLPLYHQYPPSIANINGTIIWVMLKSDKICAPFGQRKLGVAVLFGYDSSEKFDFKGGTPQT
ncbi:MAG: hypothetical protein IPL35_02145 [Sphingobacteriales bacterium]|nr:hypothetical protein [Sphingobacteriales bacterium]